MTESKKKANALRLKFWKEVIHFLSVNLMYEVEEINQYQIRIFTKSGKRIDFYPIGQKCCKLDENNKWMDITDIEKFLESEL